MTYTSEQTRKRLSSAGFRPVASRAEIRRTEGRGFGGRKVRLGATARSVESAEPDGFLSFTADIQELGATYSPDPTSAEEASFPFFERNTTASADATIPCRGPSHKFDMCNFSTH